MTNQSDAARLEEIRQRWERATPGPWRLDGIDCFSESEGYVYVIEANLEILAKLYADDPNAAASAEAIAAAPTDIAWLIALASRAVEAGERASAIMETVKAGDSVEPLWSFVDWLVPHD